MPEVGYSTGGPEINAASQGQGARYAAFASGVGGGSSEGPGGVADSPMAQDNATINSLTAPSMSFSGGQQQHGGGLVSGIERNLAGRVLGNLGSKVLGGLGEGGALEAAGPIGVGLGLGIGIHKLNETVMAHNPLAKAIGTSQAVQAAPGGALYGGIAAGVGNWIAKHI